MKILSKQRMVFLLQNIFFKMTRIKKKYRCMKTVECITKYPSDSLNRSLPS